MVTKKPNIVEKGMTEVALSVTTSRSAMDIIHDKSADKLIDDVFGKDLDMSQPSTSTTLNSSKSSIFEKPKITKRSLVLPTVTTVTTTKPQIAAPTKVSMDVSTGISTTTIDGSTSKTTNPPNIAERKTQNGQITEVKDSVRKSLT
jgi:hypothetical protein